MRQLVRITTVYKLFDLVLRHTSFVFEDYEGPRQFSRLHIW